MCDVIIINPGNRQPLHITLDDFSPLQIDRWFRWKAIARIFAVVIRSFFFLRDTDFFFRMRMSMRTIWSTQFSPEKSTAHKRQIVMHFSSFITANQSVILVKIKSKQAAENVSNPTANQLIHQFINSDFGWFCCFQFLFERTKKSWTSDGETFVCSTHARPFYIYV